ncbi:hypothetical protein MKX03_014466 [Papaver bracteatum]|nr:hypothetical protein MKX03_014466 [Papaver bracteatum]
MKRSKLETSSYLRNDCLSIHCTVGVLQTHVEDEKHCVIPVPPSDMSQKLKSLLESEIGSDITIQVGSESFKAHKSILAARSPVFRAMFFGLAGNPNMETVSIEDVDPFVFKAMLLFLYSDELPEAATTTQHLFDVADRFDLAQLKLICEAKLSEEITTDTVASTLVLAHQHQCLQLKTACLNFAAKAENVGVSESNTNNDDDMSSSRWTSETAKGCHEFKIEGYSLTKGMGFGEYITSGEFNVCGHDWVILFNPDASHDYVSVYLHSVSPRNVRATYEFKLLDQTGKEKHGNVYESPKSPTTFNPGRLWGFPHFIMRSELETSNYLKDDCLSILCTISVVKTRVKTLQTRVEQEKHCVIPVPPSDMSQKLKNLLESGIGSDITIHVGSEFFRAHKSILAARSPVFREMFFGLESNPDMEIVAIGDVDLFVFKAMLLFVYSDEFPEACDLFDSDSLCTSTTITQHLLPTAVRFELAQLKLMCEAKLCEEITANNVATTLVLAYENQCLRLKTACLNFAAKPENAEGKLHLD